MNVADGMPRAHEPVPVKPPEPPSKFSTSAAEGSMAMLGMTVRVSERESGSMVEASADAPQLSGVNACEAVVSSPPREASAATLWR